jgi:hypothetical protein
MSQQLATGWGADQPAVAFTSDFSRPGFVKMGFVPVQRFTLLVHPPTVA